MLTTAKSIALALGGVCVTLGTASAEDPNLFDKYGVGLSVGGGVAGFTNESLRDTTEVAGVWDVRATIGTKSPIALEAAYVGSAQAIDAIGLDQEAVLVGTAIEALARINLIQTEVVQPYLFAGAAWRRYDLTNADVNTSSVEEEDDLLEIPIGLGLAYRVSDFLIDARAQFRAATQEDLMPTIDGDDPAAMHTWGVTARFGYEF